MSVVVKGKNSFFIGSRAELLTTERETASEWASKHIVHNPALRWVLGKFVEADNANLNKQFWTQDDLRMGQPTIQHAPMNMLHRQRDIVGAFVATEMMYPQHAEAAAWESNPFIEALGAMWAYYFPQELAAVEKAHNEGSLFFSMECVAQSITCEGEQGCSNTFDYAGITSPTYCDHLNSHVSIKHLNEPHFLAGALVIPPARPGWARANVKQLSALVKEYAEEAEKAYEEIANELPHLSPKQWEAQMLQLLHRAKSFSGEKRSKLADSGKALPDGSFPIENTSDLKNAIQAYGRAKDKAAAKRHIIKRARQLGATSLLPEGWA